MDQRWKDKKVTISLGTIAAVAAFAFYNHERVSETFHDVTGHALEDRVELIATNLAKTQGELSCVIVQSNLSRLRDERRKLNESIRHHGDDGYNVARKVEIETELKYWEGKLKELRDGKLC